MIGKRFRSLPFIFANDNYTLSTSIYTGKFLEYTVDAAPGFSKSRGSFTDKS